MYKKKSAARLPPNQLSIRAFISGDSGWMVGDSPLLGDKMQGVSSTEEHEFEEEIHDRILSSGIFHHFHNQPAALSSQWTVFNEKDSLEEVKQV